MCNEIRNHPAPRYCIHNYPDAYAGRAYETFKLLPSHFLRYFALRANDSSAGFSHNSAFKAPTSTQREALQWRPFYQYDVVSAPLTPRGYRIVASAGRAGRRERDHHAFPRRFRSRPSSSLRPMALQYNRALGRDLQCTQGAQDIYQRALLYGPGVGDASAPHLEL